MIDDGPRRRLEVVLREHGASATAVAVISPPNPRKFGRALYRADLDDGTVVKLRIVDDEATATALVGWRAPLPEAFAPVLGQHEEVLVEAWIDGTPFPDLPPSPGRAAIAGSILGDLHRQPFGPASSTRPLLDTARADLASLRATGDLADSQADAIEALLLEGDPGTYVPSLTHRDFCGENLVATADGQLRVIDNEWFRLGPAGFDVGRTRNRWPLSPAEQEAFDAAYVEVAGPIADEALWGLVADLFGARVEHGWLMGRERPVLERVRIWASGGRP